MPDDCEELKFYAPADTFGGPRKPDACDTPVKRIPSELVEPDGTLEQPDTRKVPDRIQVWNHVRSAKCADIYPGEDVYDEPSSAGAATVEVHTFSSTVEWPDSIPETTLDYIARKNLSFVLAHEFHNASSEGEVDTAFIRSIVPVEEDAAASLLAGLVREQGYVDGDAQAQADASVDCYWLNREQSAACRPEGEDWATALDHDGAVPSYIVPEGTVKSKTGQSDADLRALVIAQEALVCLYTSDAQMVVCEDLTGREEPVPTDKVSYVEDRGPRVGTYYVQAGAFTSSASKEEANRAARKFALSMLNCYYINDPFTLDCGLTSARMYGVDPRKEPPVTGDYKNKGKGQHLSVEKGAVVSELSTEAANREARRVAEALLTCCFINREVTVRCQPLKLYNADGTPKLDKFGNQVTIAPSADISQMYEVTIPAGTFKQCDLDDPTSYESNQEVQDALDKMARNAAEQALQCMYCNAKVLPVCTPDWVKTAATTGVRVPLEEGGSYVYKLSLPIDVVDGILNPFLGKKEDFASWSMDATIGVEADTFCSSAADWEQIQQLAESMSVLLEEVKDTDCRFGNDDHFGWCSAGDFDYDIKENRVSQEHICDRPDTYIKKKSSCTGQQVRVKPSTTWSKTMTCGGNYKGWAYKGGASYGLAWCTDKKYGDCDCHRKFPNDYVDRYVDSLPSPTVTARKGRADETFTNVLARSTCNVYPAGGDYSIVQDIEPDAHLFNPECDCGDMRLPDLPVESTPPSSGGMPARYEMGTEPDNFWWRYCPKGVALTPEDCQPCDGRSRLRWVTDCGVPYYTHIAHPVEVGLSPSSSPGFCNHVHVAKNTFIFSAAEVPGAKDNYSINDDGTRNYDNDANHKLVKDYANDQAYLMMLSMLDCFYENNDTVVACDIRPVYYTDAELARNDTWKVGLLKYYKETQEHPHQVHYSSPMLAWGNEIVVPRGMFQPYKTKRDAYEAAKAFALSLLHCEFKNEEQKCDPTVECAADPVCNDATVAEGTIIAGSASEANELALALSCNMMACLCYNQQQCTEKECDMGEDEEPLIQTCCIPAGVMLGATQDEADYAALGMSSMMCPCDGKPGKDGKDGKDGAPGSCEGGDCASVYT